VEPADFVETAMVSGSLVAREETLVSPEVEGFRVVELMVEEGDEVKKGQILARLVADQLEAQIAQNDANNARSDAAIARAKSQIVEAEARQKEAEAQLERAVPLKKSGYLSGAVFDQRESAALTSEAQVAATRDALKAAEADKAQVAAQRRELEWRRGNTEVKAPTNGIVSRRSARIGAMASAAGEPMFRIISNGEIELDAEVVETELSKVKAGQKAIVSVPGGTDVDGVVRLVAPEIDKTTRLGRVKILIGRNPSLHVGAFARGSIQTASSRGLAVPPGAVMFDPKGSFVQVVTNDRIVKREVTTGLVSGGLVEIKSGLAAGDLIVARAGTFLREGDVIHPITSEKRVSAATVETK
jgi:RND family efflux transporter MFP subunit